MNIWQLTEDFRAAFASDEDFTGKNTYTGQDADNFVAPALIFTATAQYLNGSGTVAGVTLTVQVHGLSSESFAGSDPAAIEAHSAVVDAVEAKLFGTGKAALLAALNALDRWDIRGWNAGSADPTAEGMRFVTPIVLTATVRAI